MKEANSSSKDLNYISNSSSRALSQRSFGSSKDEVATQSHGKNRENNNKSKFRKKSVIDRLTDAARDKKETKSREFSSTMNNRTLNSNASLKKEKLVTNNTVSGYRTTVKK